MPFLQAKSSVSRQISLSRQFQKAWSLATDQSLMTGLPWYKHYRPGRKCKTLHYCSTNLSFLDLLFLLLHKLGWNATDIVHGTDQQLPELGNERSGVLRVQETRQVDLHLFAIGVLEKQKHGPQNRSIYRADIGQACSKVQDFCTAEKTTSPASARF